MFKQTDKQTHISDGVWYLILTSIDFTISFLYFSSSFSFDWKDISNTQYSVWWHFETPWCSSKILHCTCITFVFFVFDKLYLFLKYQAIFHSTVNFIGCIWSGNFKAWFYGNKASEFTFFVVILFPCYRVTQITTKTLLAVSTSFTSARVPGELADAKRSLLLTIQCSWL